MGPVSSVEDEEGADYASGHAVVPSAVKELLGRKGLFSNFKLIDGIQVGLHCKIGCP